MSHWERQPGEAPHIEASPEAGNIWFAEAEPVELTCWEKISFYACVGVGSVVSVAIGFGAAVWFYGALQ